MSSDVGKDKSHREQGRESRRGVAKSQCSPLQDNRAREATCKRVRYSAEAQFPSFLNLAEPSCKSSRPQKALSGNRLSWFARLVS